MTHYPNIRLRKHPDKYNWWELTEDCFVRSNLPRLTIPKGYTTDFATIPRLLWPLLPPHGKMANAAIAHDYTYDNRLGEAEFGQKQARRIADMEFAMRCLAAGVPNWQIALTYVCLRVFGRKWWRK